MGRNHKALSADMANRPNFRRIRNIWYNMHDRTANPSNPNFKNYGARGIRVCERWRNLDLFFTDVHTEYRPGLQLDRIDNDGEYCPSNCQWATRKMQANNRRNSRVFTIDGRAMTFAQWIDVSKVKRSTARQRFYVLGWPIERALGLTGAHDE